MTTLELTTFIHAPIETCFDVSRDVKIHERSAVDTKERAVAGRTTGLCELGDEITWEAVHFGMKQRLTVKITKLDKPRYFEDIMLKGAFKSMRHEHYFETSEGKTIMKDIFQYEVPAGLFGKLFDALILKKYMHRFLLVRNQVIKDVAENQIISST